jgi:hypothetical protein
MTNSEVLGELEEMVLRDIKTFHSQNGDSCIDRTESYEEYTKYVDSYWKNIIDSFGTPSPRLATIRNRLW